jgi:hypothetical protein
MSLNTASPPKRPQLQNRGISAATLLEQVRNTAPYLFADPFIDQGERYPYIRILNRAAAMTPEQLTAVDQDLWNYYELALASHFATVGTYVPTDVDLAIRQKLWNFVHHESAFKPIWAWISGMLTWDESPVSRRYVHTASGQKLSGHQGEWFTVAMAAYGSAKKLSLPQLSEVREAIEAELDREEAALLELEKQFFDDPSTENCRLYSNGVSAVIHNLGDLDRMFEIWEIDDQDVLKRRVFRSGHEDARHPRLVFQRAGQVYQKLLAQENHRHFPLREPKAIRQSPDFLLHFGPWLDDWGSTLVLKGLNSAVFTERDLRDVVVALVSGWKLLNTKSIFSSLGYARALSGVANAMGEGQYSKGRLELESLVPPIVRRELVEGGLRTLMSMPRQQFERDWAKKTLRILEAFQEE